MINIQHLQNNISQKTIHEQLDFLLNKEKINFILSTSWSIEDQVLLHLISEIAPNTNVFTLDTGRLPNETYNLMDKTKNIYNNLTIKTYYPESENLENLVNNHGINLMYESLEKRKSCCFTRKIEPLKRALKNFEGWITGLRKEQSQTRDQLQVLEFDTTNDILKYNPLLDWNEEKVWKYIKKYNIPYNELYRYGYKSIGCSPCSRPVPIGGNIRDGRWWWEDSHHKECGLHYTKKEYQNG